MVTKHSTGSRADSFRVSFNNYLNDFGTSVVINSVSETFDSMNRVISVNKSSKTINADIQWVTKSDLQHLNLGLAEIGDGMLFTKFNEVINLEDEIVYKNNTWKIVQEIEGEEVKGELTYRGFLIRKNA